MTSAFLLYLGIGKLLTYLGQKFLSNFENKFLKTLAGCDLCLGVWVYSALAVFFKITILSDVFPFIPVLSGLITGCVSSFGVHIFTLGWKTKFDVVVI